MLSASTKARRASQAFPATLAAAVALGLVAVPPAIAGREIPIPSSALFDFGPEVDVRAVDLSVSAAIVRPRSA